MSKLTGDVPAPGPNVEGEDEAPSTEDGAEAAPVDLKATVTLSGEALAALLEEVNQTRKTAPAISSIPTPIANTLPAVDPPAADKRAEAAKPVDTKNKGDGEGRGWWPGGWGQPAKR
ncbi:MAG TPA: hypothetical protein VGG33_10700 [Polyangia bacterium]